MNNNNGVNEAKAKLFLVDLYELFGDTTFNDNNIKHFIENYSFSNKTELDSIITSIIYNKLNNLSSKNQIMIKNNKINYDAMLSFLRNNKELILNTLSEYYNYINKKEVQQRKNNYKRKQNKNREIKNAEAMKKIYDAKKTVFKETKLNFQAPKLTENKKNDALKVAVISFNTEAIELYNKRLEEGKGNKTQVFPGNDYIVKSTGFKRIFTPFLKGGERIIPVEKKPGLEYIRKLIDSICENEYPDLIFFGMQESKMARKMTLEKSDKSLQSMLYELNAKVKNTGVFYSLYRSGSAREGQEGYRGNRLGIFVRVRNTVTLVEPNSPTTQKFNKTSCGKESAIICKGLNGKKIEYIHHSGRSKNSPKFYCDPYPVLEMWRYFFGDKFEKQSKLTKSNNYGYLRVNKNGKEYSFSVMNLHLPFLKQKSNSNMSTYNFGAKERDELLNKIYENMYVPDSTLILMGDLNYRFVGDRKENSLASFSRYGVENNRRINKNTGTIINNKKGITCPLIKQKGFEFHPKLLKNGKERSDYGICDRVIYKEGKDKEVYLQTRGETHSNEVAGSDHALVYSVFTIR